DTWRSFHENKQPIKKFTTTYNHSGKIATTEDGDNKFTFAYGFFGNEIKQTQNLADLEKRIEFNFVTDINGFNTEKIVKIDGKIDHTNKYEVDTLNRIANISQTANDNSLKSVNIQYDDLGQLAKQTRFDSGKEIIATKNKYDLAGRLINISHTGNNKTIYADYDLKWDNANRITDFDFTYLNGHEKRSESKYRYDKTSQLINASYNFMQHEKYDFDLNGNRKQAEIQGQKQTYKTGEYNRLLSDENYSYKYDLEGNRISKTSKDGTTTKYFWDNRNRLVKVSTPTNEIEYLYDYLNRLVQRKQNDIETIFVHDGWQIILQFDNKESKLAHRYLWGTKQDELICDNNNWMLGDHLNTIRDIVQSDSNVVDHLEYNSFGKLISETENDLLFFAYTGKLTDKSSELQWNINRWYDSNIGRWVIEYLIGFEGGDMNLYRHVDNSVVLYTDLFGLWKIRRDSSKSIVYAYAEQNDTFSGLAQLIGLDVAQKNNWLTPYNGEILGATPICGNKYGIPNTILRAWFGEVDQLGKLYMQWYFNKTRLNRLGFYVDTFDNDDDAYVGKSQSYVRATFVEQVQLLGQDKKLHGLYFMGHGSQTAIGSEGTRVYTRGPQWQIDYIDIGSRVGYLLGAAIIQACESDNANARGLVSQNGIFKGYTGTYIPRPFNIAKFWGAENVSLVTDNWGLVKPFTRYGSSQATDTFIGPHQITEN
ncbi:MAG: hypothetical protein LBC02_04130, partial [Planctomycetaceae bacterium]|nr:hypothetical protein [Planctomycetaceae bacterium]